MPLARVLGGALAKAVLAGGTYAPGGRGAPFARGATGAAGGARGTGSGDVVLVPVPSARRQVRARGHDPARRIALAAAGRLRRAGVPARVAPVLRLRRAVADQAGLGARQRRENIAGALAVCRDGPRLTEGARVVLVDDLITTGATLAEAARAVRAAGLAGGPGAALRAAVVAAPADSFGRRPRGTPGPATRTEPKSRE